MPIFVGLDHSWSYSLFSFVGVDTQIVDIIGVELGMGVAMVDLDMDRARCHDGGALCGFYWLVMFS